MHFIRNLEIDTDESNTKKRVIEAFLHLGYQQHTSETSLEFTRGSDESSTSNDTPSEWLVNASAKTTSLSSQLTKLSLHFNIDIEDSSVTESARLFWKNDTGKAARFIQRGIEDSSGNRVTQLSHQNNQPKVTRKKFRYTPRNILIAWTMGLVGGTIIGVVSAQLTGSVEPSLIGISSGAIFVIVLGLLGTK